MSDASATVPAVPPAWAAFVDDATLLAPDAAPTAEALAAHALLRDGSLGALAVRDTDLPLLRGATHPLRVVLTAGAGAVAGPLALASRLGLDVRAVQVALRDVDDLAGNARRVVAAVDAARADGVLDDEVAVHVEVPTDLPGGVAGGWARAADEVAAAELALHFRVAGPVDVRPDEVAGWLDAALDRETPYSVQVAAAVSGSGAIGAVNLLLATRRAFDGEGRDAVAAVLAEGASVVEAARSEEYLAGARRWLTSVVANDPAEVLTQLRSNGLLDAP